MAFVAAVAGEDVARRDYWLLHKDGSVVWVDARPRALFDQKTGKIIGVTDVVRDVTARKQAKAALAASEERSYLTTRPCSPNLKTMRSRLSRQAVVTL